MDGTRSETVGPGMGGVMKRTFAVVMLLASLGVLLKLARQPIDPGRPAAPPIAAQGPAIEPAGGSPSDADSLLARYRTASPRVREMVSRLSGRFGRNADAIDRTDGERGLVLLDKLDMEALLL